ncbi:hypothetical protein P280DRAFT_473393 [Massarina eburnea CBS 473.64]|uniref:Mitochondrial export translocase Oxa2 n=1 Tax=Massarina eburnea CBS 473.64 TaxID=1395130 RepID=A0A6A6RN41_9PLEO|nr:hypothetical protein P280DRAFT_473393 [Massarina eburnea CBS 473.64]
MLTTRLPRPSARQLLARSPLPSSHNAQTLPLRRAFHATAPRKDAVLDAILYLPYEMMTMIHTHVPWYATLPLSAFIVRGMLVTCAGSWARSLQARYIGLHPLRQAMAQQKRREIQAKGGFETPKAAKLAIRREIRKITSAFDKRWNCTVGKQLGWTVVQIPLFFTMAEVIRKMCNARDGLLGLSLTGLGLKEKASTTHGVDLGPPNLWFEPSLANEGMLWFPDLLVPDPTGVLPFVVSGLMFTNVYFSRNGPSHMDNMPTFSKFIRRLLLGVSLMVGPLCQQLPGALVLYWASSTTSVIVWNWWLDWKYPTPLDHIACKRPLQPPLLPLKKVKTLHSVNEFKRINTSKNTGTLKGARASKL